MTRNSCSKQTAWNFFNAVVARSALGVVSAAAVFSSTAQAGNTPLGVWLDDKGRGAIEITSCGSKLCGHVVWTRSEADAKRGCGKKMIGDVSKAGGNVWAGGWIYSPERRRNFDVELTPLKSGKLRVVGYAGIKLFSKTMIWSPAPADLVRCDAVEAKADPAAKPTPGARAGSQQAALAPAPQMAPVTTTPAPVAPTQDTATASPEAVAPITSDKDATSTDTAKPQARTEPTAHGNNATNTDPDSSAAAAADDDTASDDNDDTADTADRIDLGQLAEALGGEDLNLKNIFKRTKSGDCKVDLPWVKVEFECRDR